MPTVLESVALNPQRQCRPACRRLAAHADMHTCEAERCDGLPPPVRGEGSSSSDVGSSSPRLSSLQTDVPLPMPGISSSCPSCSKHAFVRLVKKDVPCLITCMQAWR